jgi:hypothetical protein
MNARYSMICHSTITWLTIHGFRIDDRIYWTIWYSAWLHFTVHYDTHTHISGHSHVFPNRCLVAVSNGGRFPSPGLRNCARPQLPESHSNSSQRPNVSSSLTDSLTDWLTQSLKLTQINWLSLTVLLITYQHGPLRKYRSMIAVQLLARKQSCLRSRYLIMTAVYLRIPALLPSNGSACHNTLKFGTFREKIAMKCCLTVVVFLHTLSWLEDLTS